MNKWLMVFFGMLFAAWLYGWRLHIDAIGHGRKIVTRDNYKNVFRNWKTPDIVDSLSGPPKFVEPPPRPQKKTG